MHLPTFTDDDDDDENDGEKEENSNFVDKGFRLEVRQQFGTLRR